MWAAYGRVCKRLGIGRSDDILAHIRARIREHGDEQDLPTSPMPSRSLPSAVRGRANARQRHPDRGRQRLGCRPRFGGLLLCR